MSDKVNPRLLEKRLSSYRIARGSAPYQDQEVDTRSNDEILTAAINDWMQDFEKDYMAGYYQGFADGLKAKIKNGN